MMTEHEFLDDRRRASEDDYFRKKDRELIEKMRQASAAERAKSELSAKTGLTDPDLVKELQELGFTPDTIAVLPLVPIVQMAWAEGGITSAERQLLVTLARQRDIAAGSSADALLSEWMAKKPSDEVFKRATRLIRAMLEAGGPDTDAAHHWSAEDVIRYSESIAAASGGIFGLGKISADEREVLASIAETLKGRS
jgi:tellurite resistance protein